MAIRPLEEIFIFYIFVYCLPNAMPLASHIYFVDGNRVLHLQEHLTNAESPLVAMQCGILANRYLLLECELAVLPCWLQLVACTLLTTMRCTSHSLVIVAGLRDADRSPLGSGRSSKG